ncbi:MAG: PadR family transcriptional regulator [Acidimicrobiales bacterium]
MHQHHHGPRDIGLGLAGSPRGRRMRRGDIRPLVLVTLLDGPAHGYEVIRRLEERSSGLWKPSPGSVYPTLQMLSDEGALISTETDGKRTYQLTDEGRAEAEGHQASGGHDPWANDPSVKGRFALRVAMAQLHHAAHQVASVGGSTDVDGAVEILRQARQSLYKILADS